jgi:TRAP-type C4-dicarboxylate transport system substrate-binding protein
MKKRILLIPLAILLAISLVAIGCPAPPEETTPPPGTTAPPPETTTPPPSGPITLVEANWPPAQMPPPIFEEPFHLTVDQWMNVIEYRTEGEVTFERYPSETLVKMGDMWESVKMGICDIAMVNVMAFPGQFPMSASLRVPGFFENSIQGSMVRQTLLEEGYMAAEWSDVKVLWFGTNAPHSIACRTKQITKIEDLKGLKVANMGEPESTFLEALGAVSVPMPATEFYLALERGTVDAVVQDTNGMVVFQLYQVAPYITEIPGNANSAMVVVMNLDSYNSLPANIKALFDNSTGLLRSICHGKRFDYNHEACLDYLNTLEDSPPVQVLSEQERAKFFQTVDPLIEAMLADLEAQGMPARDMHARAHELVELYKLWGF